MKKTLRLLATLLTVVLFSTTLCGCRSLDKMRECHAVTTENGDVLLNGTVYKPLLPHDALTGNRGETNINLTAPDVPLLLSTVAADSTLWVSKDRILLFDLDNEVYYCREDHYEDISQQIVTGPVYTTCFFEYGYRDEETYEYIECTHTFTEEQAAALDTILSTVAPVAMDYLSYLAAFEPLVDIFRCSADKVFREHLCTIVMTDNTYCLSMGVDNDTVAVYRVPDVYASIFADIHTMLPETY